MSELIVLILKSEKHRSADEEELGVVSGFNIWLAQEAHARGLSIGLKNDSEQVSDLLPYYDWALTEDCFDQDWCEEMLPFVEAGKPVFAAEYTDTGITLADFCPQAGEMGISAILKNRGLDAFREACP